MAFEKTIPLVPPIARYRIIRELGRGTMGIVYEAFDPVLERAVALKTVRLETGPHANHEFEQRFQREAKSAGRLNHPNIVTIHDAGEEGGTAYIAMEFLEGRTLRSIIDGAVRLPAEEAVGYAIQIAEGLDYAHRFGVIHRDIKPDNIIVSDYGRTKITDFGIAQLPLGNLTQTGAIMGTPKYMSPEQIRGERLDGRSDIFSLGVILYEMLAGKPPFLGDSMTSTMYKILQELPADPSAANCPAGIRQIIARSLAKDKQQRYAQAGEMAADLRRHLEIAPDAALMTASFKNDATSSIPEKTGAAARHSRTEKKSKAGEAPSFFPLQRKPALFVGAGMLSVALIALAYWAKASPPPAKPAVTATATSGAPQAAPAKNPAPEKLPVSAAPTSPEPAPAKAPAKKKVVVKAKSEPIAEASPKKSFWRRQIDCIKGGACDKADPPTQPLPPGF